MRDGVESEIDPLVCSVSCGTSSSGFGESIGVGSSSSRDTSVACEASECNEWLSITDANKDTDCRLRRVESQVVLVLWWFDLGVQFLDLLNPPWLVELLHVSAERRPWGWRALSREPQNA